MSRLFPHFPFFKSLFWSEVDQTEAMTDTERSQELFLIWGAFIPFLPNCDLFFLSPCCTTHMKVFTCTILSGKTRHLARPQGNHFAEVFHLFSFVRIWFSFFLSPVSGYDNRVLVSYTQQYHGDIWGSFLEAEMGSHCAVQPAITGELCS